MFRSMLVAVAIAFFSFSASAQVSIEQIAELMEKHVKKMQMFEKPSLSPDDIPAIEAQAKAYLKAREDRNAAYNAKYSPEMQTTLKVIQDMHMTNADLYSANLTELAKLVTTLSRNTKVSTSTKKAPKVPLVATSE